MPSPKIHAKPKSASREHTRPAAAVQPADAAPGTLYLVPLPIGNLGDITQRALEVLKSVNVIAAEDTRTTAKLLQHFKVKTKLVACHDHNEQAMAPRLIAQLQAGQNIALVSDAGTPLVSDPGYRIVQAAIDAEMPMTALPGANAILPALQMSGLPPHTFYFNGFLPTRSAARQRSLTGMADMASTLVFYEAPHRLADMLDDAMCVFGRDRAAAVVREISKKFEQAKRGTLYQLKEFYERHPVRGEIVVVIAGQNANDNRWNDDKVHDALAAALAGGVSFRDAVAIISADSHWPKKEVYQAALTIKGDAEN